VIPGVEAIAGTDWRSGQHALVLFARTDAEVQPFIIPTQNRTSVISAMGQNAKNST